MTVRRIQACEIVRADGTLADPDYVDAFELHPADRSGSAEQWVRACFEDAPPAIRWFLLFGWRFVLGLRLGPRPSPDHVLGWRIVAAGAETVVLGTDSRVLGRAQLVLGVAQTQVVLGTLIRFQRRGARLIWSVVGLIHRRVLPYLLAYASRNPTLPNGTSQVQ